MDLFLVSAVSTVLLVRLFLSLTGYPTVDNGTLHIAHALWGGLLMMVSCGILLASLGHRMRSAASLIGGVGFGLFIDELGKFVTHDSNYFFHRSVAIIYVIFVCVFIWSWSIRRTRPLAERDYLVRALKIAQDGILYRVTRSERDEALAYLHHCDQSNPTTIHLMQILTGLDVAPAIPLSRPRRWFGQMTRAFRQLIQRRLALLAIDAIFIVKAVTLPIIVVTVLVGEPLFDANMAILQLISTIIAGGFAIAGVWWLRSSQTEALELFAKSILIDIFFTQTFLFYRIANGGIVILALSVLLYFALRSLIYDPACSQLTPAWPLVGRTPTRSDT